MRYCKPDSSCKHIARLDHLEIPTSVTLIFSLNDTVTVRPSDRALTPSVIQSSWTFRGHTNAHKQCIGAQQRNTLVSHLKRCKDRGVCFGTTFFSNTLGANGNRSPYSSTNGKFGCSGSPSKRRLHWTKRGRRLQWHKWI